METVKIRTPQSLLSLLPRLVGPTHAPSLVALPFHEGRSGMPMTLDLPPAGTPDAPAIAAAILRGMRGGDAVVLIACLEQPLGAEPLPLQSELAAIAAELARAGIDTLELLALGPDAWGDYAYPEAPRGPLAELDLLDDPAPGVPTAPPLPDVPTGSDGAAARAVLTWLALLQAHDLEAAIADPIGALELAVATAPQLGVGRGGLGIDPAKAAAIAILLADSPARRDLAIELALDGLDAAHATLARADGDDASAGDAAAERFLGIGPAPDPDRLHERLRRWSAIADATPAGARAPLLVIVGFLHFFLGRGRTAARCAELASALDPQLSMAALLRQIVDVRTAPDWVLRPAADADPLVAAAADGAVHRDRTDAA